MAKNEVNYYFGRLNLIANYDDKHLYLMDSFTSGKNISKKGFKWDLINITEISINEKNFITGYLVKYKNFDDENVVDELNRTLSTVSIENRSIAESRFFIHPKSGIIAFHPIEGKIGHNQFKEIFAELIEAGKDYILVKAEVQFIDEDIRILEAIKSFDRILFLSIELHPSNPSFRKRWQKTDEKLKEMEAVKYKQSYQSENGLKISENSDVYGDILMAGDGYGKADLEGLKDGKTHRASTDETPLIIKGLREGKPEEILKSIFHMYEKIWERVKEQ